MNQHRDGGPERRATSHDRRSRERRVLAVGLALSILVHIVVIGVVGGLLGERPEARDGPTPVVIEPPRGMRAVELSVPTGTDMTLPDMAAPEPRSEEEPAAPPRQVADAELEQAEADDLTAADRLAPRLVDPRLWRPVVLLPREPTLADVQARIRAAVELLSDSALAEADRAVRARDWTVEDADGGRWGISPGLLHLGKLTLPLPIAFPVPMGPDERAAASEWYDIQEQAERAVLLESFEERVKAIRERRERERSERPDGGSDAP